MAYRQSASGVMSEPPLAQALYLALSDGACHSGETLARQLGVTRSAVWKAIEVLRELGLSIRARPRHGYLLDDCPEALSKEKLIKEIETGDGSLLPELALQVVWELESSNTALLDAPPPPFGKLAVLLVENQLGGRGRRGRQWQSRLGDSLCFSLALRVDTLPADLAALPLVVGLGVRRVLRSAGVSVQLKWPNDLVIDRGAAGLAKLGGILVELRAETGGPALIVVGVGLNLRMDLPSRARIASEGGCATDLQAEGLAVHARNRLAAGLIRELRVVLADFCRKGFAPLREHWCEADVLQNRRVTVEQAGRSLEGIAAGIDAQGALQVRVEGRLESVYGGEVSVRPCLSV